MKHYKIREEFFEGTFPFVTVVSRIAVYSIASCQCKQWCNLDEAKETTLVSRLNYAF